MVPYVITSLNGTQTTLRYNEREGTVHVSNRLDAEPVTDLATTIRNEQGKGIPKHSGGMRLVALLDPLTNIALEREGIFDEAGACDSRRFRNWLNDRTHSKFRACEGKV
jgi:hypothetical protein